MAGYDPSATTERLQAERDLVAGNLDGWYRQIERNGPPTPLIAEAIERARRRLDWYDEQLASSVRVNVTPPQPAHGRGGGRSEPRT